MGRSPKRNMNWKNYKNSKKNLRKPMSPLSAPAPIPLTTLPPLQKNLGSVLVRPMSPLGVTPSPIPMSPRSLSNLRPLSPKSVLVTPMAPLNSAPLSPANFGSISTPNILGGFVPVSKTNTWSILSPRNSPIESRPLSPPMSPRLAPEKLGYAYHSDTYVVRRSDKNGKKFYVETPSAHRVYFGAAGYEDFTMHKDEARKQRYINRHNGGRENWDDPETAGFWSRWLLWNLPTLEDSARDISRQFNIKVSLV